MALARLALRPDARLAVAAGGVAAAILLPLLATLAISALQTAPDPEQVWVVGRSDGAPFDATAFRTPPRLAVAHAPSGSGLGDRALAAYVIGPAGVADGHAVPMPAATTAPLVLNGVPQTLDKPPAVARDLLSTSDTLVSPAAIGAPRPDAALFQQRPSNAELAAQGLEAFQSPGGGAYIREGVNELRSATGILVFASLPVVALVALGFGDLEARSLSRTVATLAALGRPGLGSRLVAIRAGLVAGIGMGIASAIALAVYFAGPAAFHPQPFPRDAAVVAVVVPGAVAAAVAFWRSRAKLGPAARLLRAPPNETEPPSRRVPWLPSNAQPILLGTRAVPVLLLAAVLFSVDLGFPLAASSVPGAVAGGDGELVLGSFDGMQDNARLVFGGHTDIAPANALAFDPVLSGVLAETLAPTTLHGHALMVRGGDWDKAAAYHGLRITEGRSPGPDGIAFGASVAGRLDVAVGDTVAIAATDRPAIRVLRVDGVFAGPSLLADEAYVALATGQDLAGLAPDQVTLVRARPDTMEGMAALSRETAKLEVISLRHAPPVPAAGQLVRVDIELVNLGGAAGTRLLNLRVDGVIVGDVTAQLGPYGRGNTTAYIVAPAAGFSLQVNPTANVEVTPAALRLDVPDIVFAPANGEPRPPGGLSRVVDATGAPVADQRVAAFASIAAAANGTAAVAVARSGADGGLDFGSLPPASYVLSILDVPVPTVAILVVGDARHAAESWIVPEHLFADSATPAPGDVVTITIEARNVGGVAGSRVLDLVAPDGSHIAIPVSGLDPGKATRLQATITANAGRNAVTVDGAEIAFLATFPTTPGTNIGPILRTPESIRSSHVLQKQVADSVLLQARQALVAIGATAMLASLAVVLLSVDRSVRGRMHALRALGALGVDAPRLRARAAAEGAILGAAAGLVACLLTYGLFSLTSLTGWPLVFGHRLPNPVGVAFAIETAATFALVTAIAAFRVVSAAVRDDRFVRREGGGDEALPPASIADVLQGARP